jgi:hypothetical protein
LSTWGGRGDAAFRIFGMRVPMRGHDGMMADKTGGSDP